MKNHASVMGEACTWSIKRCYMEELEKMKNHASVMGEALYVEYKEMLRGGVGEDEESCASHG